MGSKFSYDCHYCGKINHKSNKHSYVGKYCNNKCQAAYQNKLKIEQWLSGTIAGHTSKILQVKRWVKKYLIEIRGNKCDLYIVWKNVYCIDLQLFILKYSYIGIAQIWK